MIVITGGGTGGHIVPAMSLAETFIKRGQKVLYIGSERGIERKIFNLNVNKVFLNLAGIKGKGLSGALKGVILTIIAVFKVIFLFIKLKPSIVVGTGGFVCIPAVIGGYFTGAKIYLQEQNAVPGASVKYLSKLARKVFVGFEDCKNFFPTDKVMVTGNPIKSIFFSQEIGYNKLKEDEKLCILVIGGSQGSKFINELLFSAIKYIDSKKIKIFHQTGERYKDTAIEEYRKRNVEAEIFAFTDKIFDYYKRSHLVIGRAGAMSLSELIAVKRPAILIPFPHAIYDHQAKNGEFLKKTGSALLYRENEIDGKKLAELIDDFHNHPEKLELMAKNYEKIDIKNSSEIIVDYILEDAGV
ncbi:MAG: undecaprenyldiphospho-muramoylpentapeptide beta-N-acetylglucosaminyltransferase [Proteobacteria bacterium]|nr:undecaprenyldiphospho-muramoylpentapeptide beta-N-acetylglucosaminyltransferase [Pseudomonadota bacterium]